MSLYFGPRSIIHDGLYFHMDCGNPRSEAGEPTTNLFTNPRFDGGKTGWTTTNTHVTYDPTESAFDDGSGCIRFDNPDGDAQTNQRCYQTIYTGPGDYTFSGYFKRLSEEGRDYLVSMLVYYYDDENTVLGSSNQSFVISSTRWERVDRQFEAPAGTDHITPYLYRDDSILSHFVADNLQFEAKDHVTTFVEGTRSVLCKDLSPRKNHLISSTPPNFITNANGRPTFQFDGSTYDQYLTTQNNSGISGTDHGFCCFAVINQYSRTNSYSGVITLNQGSSYNCMSMMSYAGRIATDHWEAGGRRTGIVIPAAQTCLLTWNVPDWATHRTDTWNRQWLNGVVQTNSSYGSHDPAGLPDSPFIVGNWQITRDDMNFHGEIERILFYNRSMTDDEIDYNNALLMERYKLS